MAELPLFVVVSGPPGTGKSTIASRLAVALWLPLIAKDTIKEALFDALGAADPEESTRLGRAAIDVMYAVAKRSPVGAVLECNFRGPHAREQLALLTGDVIEVFCRCDPQVARRRYRERTSSRHPVHFDDSRSDDELCHPEEADPIAGEWPVLEINTDRPIELDVIAQEILTRTTPRRSSRT